MVEPFQLPFGSREERIAHNQAWARSLNEQQAEWSGHEAPLNFRCECWQADCPERVPLASEEWTLVRSKPNQFAVLPGHVAENFEAVIEQFAGFWLVEKFGEAGRVAEEWAESKP